MYCKKCGGKLESYANNCAFCGTPVEKYDEKVHYVNPKESKKTQPTMTTLKWIGLFLLPGIPVLGAFIYLILMFKWAFGKNKDLTLKGFARANLVIMVIAVILIIAFTILLLPLIPEILEQLQSQIK